MDHVWLQKQFELHPDKSKADLARALNLEPPAISKILSGTRQIKAAEYVGMRRFFGLPNDGERAIQDPQREQAIQPLTSALKEDGDESSGWVIPENVLKAQTSSKTEHIKVFTVEDTFMQPDFKKGENVLVDLQHTTPSPPGAYIISDGYGFMLRNCEYVAHSNPPEVRLSAKKEGFETQILALEGFHIVGRVIAKLEFL